MERLEKILENIVNMIQNELGGVIGWSERPGHDTYKIVWTATVLVRGVDTKISCSQLVRFSDLEQAIEPSFLASEIIRSYKEWIELNG